MINIADFLQVKIIISDICMSIMSLICSMSSGAGAVKVSRFGNEMTKNFVKKRWMNARKEI